MENDRIDPLIVTAAFDETSAAIFQALRDAHFPAHLNIVPAHLTLFHALPGVELTAVVAAIRAACGAQAVIPFTTAPARFLGRGVALPIEAPALAGLRDGLARRFAPWLTPQDRQGFRAHVTVQNKVPPAEARALQAVLLGAASITGAVVGLELWAYRAGPWQIVARFAFAGDRGA